MEYHGEKKKGEMESFALIFSDIILALLTGFSVSLHRCVRSKRGVFFCCGLGIVYIKVAKE